MKVKRRRPRELPAVLFVPDTHAPYHDKRAWDVMLRAAKVLQPEYVVVLGDLGDFYSISRHRKDPSRPYRLADEVASVNERLDELDALKPKHKIFCEGNHEARLAAYIAGVAAELHGLGGTTIAEILGLKERGWKRTPYHETAKIGRLSMTHEAGFCGKYAVQHTRDMYNSDVVFGHTHGLEIAFRGDLNARPLFASAMGWLGDLKWIDYRHKVGAKRSYVHGFGVGHFDASTGRVHVQPVPILDRTAVINGKVVS